jgi:hypothetical protein
MALRQERRFSRQQERLVKENNNTMSAGTGITLTLPLAPHFWKQKG